MTPGHTCKSGPCQPLPPLPLPLLSSSPVHSSHVGIHSPSPWLVLVSSTHAVSRPGPVVCSPHSRSISPCRSRPEGHLLRGAFPDSKGHCFISSHHPLVITCVHSFVLFVVCLAHHEDVSSRALLWTYLRALPSGKDGRGMGLGREPIGFAVNNHMFMITKNVLEF